MVTKCLSASKQKTKDKGMEIIMLYIELDKPDLVQVCVYVCVCLSAVGDRRNDDNESYSLRLLKVKSM